MLTRRDQLKLKDEKAQIKKEGKDANKDKEDKTTGENGKGKRKGKGKGKVVDDVNPEPKPKASTKRKETKQVAEEPEPAEPPKKRQAKAAAKRNPAAKAEEAEPVATELPKTAPKAKAKGKGKAKAKAKAVALPMPSSAPDLEKEEESVETPKKKLFQSEDEEEYGSFAGGDERDIMADELLQEAKMRAKEEKAGKKKAPKSRAKAKAKANAKVTRKADLSPFAKKEKSRRKKAEQEVMQAGAQEDLELQGLLLQHLKNVHNLPFDGVKKYLQTQVQSKFEQFQLNSYWNRSSCGTKCLMLGDGTIRKAPEICYFGKCNNALSWNINMSLAYIAASLMVSCHFGGVMGKDGDLRAFTVTYSNISLG